MSDGKSKQPPRLSEKGRENQKLRTERRAALLRENLRKRKVQRRRRKDDERPGG